MARRTKKQYADLYDNPSGLLKGCKVILFPNGEPGTIFIQAEDGTGGFCIGGEMGPTGLSLRIMRTSPFHPPITMSGNDAWDRERYAIPAKDANYVELCQYRTTAYAQAYKAWYTDPDHNKHPSDLGLKP